MRRVNGGMTIALGFVLAIVVDAGHGLAQPRGSSDAEARGLFDAATAAFDDGRFEDALGYFRRAHELSQRPELLFNIATTCERLRLDREAVESYEAYLRALPNAGNRAFVESRIAFLRRVVDSTPPERRVETGTDAGTPPTPREVAESASTAPSDGSQAAPLDDTPAPHARRRRIILISIAAAVVAGAAVGLAVGLSGRDGTSVVRGDVGPGGIVYALEAP